MKTTFIAKIKDAFKARAKLLLTVFAMTFVAVGTLIYQNCTAPLASGIKSVDALAASMPWAYDAQVDQIAYMSCSELVTGFDTSQYFMLRAGAYGSSAGLTLTTDFLNKTQGGYTTQRADLLDEGTENSGTKIIYSMRNAADFQSVYPSTATVGTDWNSVFTDIGVEDTSDALVTAVAASTKLRFVSTGLLPGARFEGDLEGDLGAAPYAQYRSYFNNSQILFGVNFMADSGEVYARAPADTATTTSGYTANQAIYGRGLYLKFGFPSVTGLASTMPNYVLSETDEYDMSTRTSIGTWGTSSSRTWQCPTTMQLRIVRAEDLAQANVNCVIASDTNTTYNSDTASMAIIRRSLRTEDWYVNIAQRCIIPKKVTGSQCYGGTANLHVQYDETQACSAPATTGVLVQSTCAQNPDGTPDTTSASCVYTNATCVHYASICYRP